MEKQRRNVYNKYGDKRTLMYWAKQNGIKITGNESKDVLIDLLLNAPNKPSSTNFVKFIQSTRANVYEQIGTVSTLRQWAQLHNINVQGLQTKKELINALINSSNIPSSTAFYKRYAHTTKNNADFSTPPDKNDTTRTVQSSSSSSSSESLIKRKIQPSTNDNSSNKIFTMLRNVMTAVAKTADPVLSNDIILNSMC